MPEGPEAKIVADFINKKLKNKTITKVSCVSDPYKKRFGQVTKEIKQFLPFKYQENKSIGKHTFIPLNKKTFFSYHLGMSGYWSTEINKHCHLKVETDQNFKIYFHDVRRFGNIKIINQEEINKKHNHQFDFLNHEVEIKEYEKYLLKLNPNINICKVLMNQKHFPGVGNYLKAEILYDLKMSPHKKWGELSKTQIKLLCNSTKRIIRNSYIRGGGELKDFHNPESKSSLELKVYGKKEDAFKNKIKRELTPDKRTTWWCPDLQTN